jgi:hypothetical protein
MEKQCSAIFTHEVFKKFQEQLLVARDHCIIQGISESENMKIVTISSLSRKERVVQMSKSNMFGTCSCKVYESYGIPCCHVIQVLRGEKLSEIPSICIMKRWEKRCKRWVNKIFFVWLFLFLCWLSLCGLVLIWNLLISQRSVLWWGSVNTKNWYRRETDLWAEFGKETPFGRNVFFKGFGKGTCGR